MSDRDLAALARHASGHATVKDWERILRMAGESERKPYEGPPLPRESWAAVGPKRSGSV